MNIRLKSAELYLGRRAGRRVLAAVRGAEESVRVMSPYLAASLVDVLLEKAEEGVDVRLLTSTEFEARGEAAARRLLVQRRRVRRGARFVRRLGLLFSFLGLAGALGAGGFGLWGGDERLVRALAAAPVALVLFLLFRAVRVFDYFYETRIPFASVVSPNTDGRGAGRFLVHAKAYVVDERAAFVGSANFTRAGFGGNYESLAMIDDPDAVRAIVDEFERLGDDPDVEFRDVDEMGRALFPEPGR